MLEIVLGMKSTGLSSGSEEFEIQCGHPLSGDVSLICGDGRAAGKLNIFEYGQKRNSRIRLKHSLFVCMSFKYSGALYIE